MKRSPDWKVLYQLICGVVPDSSSVLEISNFLTPPELQKPVCWRDLKKKLHRNKDRTLKNVADWIESGDEDSFKKHFPPRTKQDLAIRRTRASDMHYHMVRTKNVDLVRTVLNSLCGEFDYIAAVIISWAVIIHGLDWYKNLLECGCFDDGIETFSKNASTIAVTILVSSDKSQIKDWTKYIGLSSLGGYRNPPYPGFDMLKESENLANAGIPSFFPPGLDFDTMADAKLYTPKAAQYVSFRDYVVQGMWLTAGASSIGSIEIVVDGKTSKIKARKNFVADVYPLEEVYRLAVESKIQINKTLIKSELGKIRLAVAGDLLTYLKMAWVTKLTGGGYLNWEGSNLKEDVYQQALRMEKFLKLVHEKHGLPYDYRAFDHQPETPEIKSICRQLIALGRYNVPEGELYEYKQITDKIVESFDHSILQTKIDDQIHKWDVIGGLMSGLAWTSLIGNAWNTVKTACSRWILTQCGRDLSAMDCYVRGDDSAIFDPNVVNLLLMNEAYKAQGVEGGDGKFSVQKHGMEFLRIWYSERCFGYPNRALPGLVQRKPWSNQPWTDDNVIKSIYDTITILTRRGCDVQSVWVSLSNVWCKLHKIPRAVLSIPRSMGGFGIEPWTGWTVSPPLPKVEVTNQFQAVATTEWRENRVRQTAQAMNIWLNDTDFKTIAQEQLNQVIGADDVPLASRALRDYYNAKLKKWKPKLTKVDMPYVDTFTRIPNTVASLEAKFETDITNTTKFGKYRHESKKINDFKMFARYVGVSLSDWLRLNIPDMHRDLLKIRRFNHQSTAIDWLLGEASINIENVHPAATKYVKATVVYSVARNGLSDLNKKLAAAATAVAGDFFVSTISQRLFCW